MLCISVIYSIGILASYSDFQTYMALAQQDNITGNQTRATPPVAHAGGDQTLSEGEAVQLNGSASIDPQGGTLRFVWNQTSGTPVTLSDLSSATPTFTAPDVGANGDTLTFELTVNGTEGNTASDTVNVNVSDDAGSINQRVLIDEIFQSYLPHVFIIIVFLVIIVPLVLDIILAYKRTPAESSTSKRALGMPGLNRSLMTFGIIILLGTVIFYLLALITLNMDNANSPAFQSLIDLLRNLGIILGTALATIIAFYFGVRGSESAVEKTAAAVAETITPTRVADVTGPPRVLSTTPHDRARAVSVLSPIIVSFSKPMTDSSINSSTFRVIKEHEDTPLRGSIIISPDAKNAVFDPDPNLEPDTKYIARITEGAEDLTGNPLASTYQWSFTTEKEEEEEEEKKKKENDYDYEK